jgi:hypothetical protein
MYRAITYQLAFIISVSRENVSHRTDRYQNLFKKFLSHFSSGSGLNKKYEGCDELGIWKTRKRVSKGKIFILSGRHSFITYHFHSGLEKPQTPVPVTTPCSSISEHFSHNKSHLITLTFRVVSECETPKMTKIFHFFVTDEKWLDQRPLPSGLVTSGSHCAVRLGHSSAWVITRSYRNGVFFFQI